MRLERLKSQRPDIFASRELYTAVRVMLDHFTFKLPARRQVTSLFSVEAKMTSDASENPIQI
jgi:hypothetical protein